jgi:hypothetical protein
VDLREREVAIGEAEAVADCSLDSLDLVVCLARVRAFVVAVDEQDVPAARAADVVGRVLKARDGRLLARRGSSAGLPRQLRVDCGQHPCV